MGHFLRNFLYYLDKKHRNSSSEFWWGGLLYLVLNSDREFDQSLIYCCWQWQSLYFFPNNVNFYLNKKKEPFSLSSVFSSENLKSS